MTSRAKMIISVKAEEENSEVIDKIAELSAWLRRKDNKRGLRCPDPRPDEVPVKVPRQEAQGPAAQDPVASASSSSRLCSTSSYIELGGGGSVQDSQWVRGVGGMRR